MIKAGAEIAQRPSGISAQTNAIFKKYWELATTNLKVAKLNELLQSNRDKTYIVEPLLKALLELDTQIEADETESCADILNLLSQLITKHLLNSNESR